MDIERLKELQQEVGDIIFNALSKLTDKDTMEITLRFGEDLQNLIDEAIARQSVKSEEVAEAIEELMYGTWQSYKDGYPITLGDKTIDLAIAALQAYQPTTQKDRIVEDVAISKTETTSAKKITVDIQIRPLLDDLEVDIEDIKEYRKQLD